MNEPGNIKTESAQHHANERTDAEERARAFCAFTVGLTPLLGEEPVAFSEAGREYAERYAKHGGSLLAEAIRAGVDEFRAELTAAPGISFRELDGSEPSLLSEHAASRWARLYRELNEDEREWLLDNALPLLRGGCITGPRPEAMRAALHREAPPAPETKREPLGDCPGEIGAADQWARAEFGKPASDAQFSRSMAGVDHALMRALIRWHQACAGEIAALIGGTWDRPVWRGVLAFLGGLFRVARGGEFFPPGPSDGPVRSWPAPHERDPGCREHGVLTPDSFPGSDFEVHSPPCCSCQLATDGPPDSDSGVDSAQMGAA